MVSLSIKVKVQPLLSISLKRTEQPWEESVVQQAEMESDERDGALEAEGVVQIIVVDDDA